MNILIEQFSGFPPPINFLTLTFPHFRAITMVMILLMMQQFPIFSQQLRSEWVTLLSTKCSIDLVHLGVVNKPMGSVLKLGKLCESQHITLARKFWSQN